MDCLCRPSRIMSVRINLLDETNFIHEIKDDLPGQALLDVVFARLNLIEISYFGIRYIDDENQTHWLDPASRISRQMKPKPDPYDLYFGVKFYAADPCKLLEEITRYQLFLQVKQDVIQGRLPVAFELAAELGAFVVQSELGDYDTRRHSKGYVSEFRLLPNQSSELETRVAELHQQLKGMSPATAELSYLDKVKWHDMYGVDLHPVLGEDSVEYFLGLTPSGIVVLRNKATVAHYYWPRIAKVYYKGRYFMLRISDKNNELSTYGFETPRKAACKHLWRCCVEHHAFFRLVRVAPLTNSQSNNSDFFQVGSRLRYSGRSEKQVSKDALSIGRTPPAFTRVPSKRQPRRVIDDFLNGGSHKNTDCFNGTTTTTMLPNGIPISSVAYESPYRSTYSIPTSLSIRPFHHNQPQLQDNYNDTGGGGGVISAAGTSNLQTPDSPRSTRSAPWPRSTQQRSLFGHNPSSPRSVRSVSVSGNANGHQHHHHHHHNQSHSNHHHHHHHQPQRQHSQRDQAHQQRHRSNSMESHSSNDSRSTRRHKHRHRRTSDNESELSRGSGRSGRSHHRKHRRSRHRRDSAGSGDHDSMRGRSYSGHRSSSARSGSAELIDSASQWREAQRRQAEAGLGQSSIQQASVSKSSMVTRSLNSNDSHSDTHSHHKSRRHRKNKSPSDSRTRIWSSELAKHLQFDLVDTAGMTEDQLREIPYTVVETNSKRSTSNLKIHKSNSKNSVGGKSTGSGTTSHGNASNSGAQAKNRVDRIRGLYLQGSQPQELTGIKNGSIRSASTISSRECERNNGLVRMMSSMSMGDFITPIGTNLSPLENSALRVSHEHTDSGLGADQDYAYSSERSSDSTRYGTNISSGASSGSHRKSAGQSAGSGYNNLLQQTVSNQQQQHQQQYLQQKQQNQKPRETSLHYAQTQHQQHSHKNNYKYNTQSSTNQNQSNTLAPIHNLHNANKNTHKTTSSNHSTNSIHIQNNNNNNHNNPNANGNGKNVSEPSPKNKEAGNRLLNYTTFENNQYKFSLNNIFGKRNINMGAVVGNRSTNNINTNIQKDLDSFVEWPNTPAAPYYYEMPCTSRNQVAYKKRDAKSDIGVPIGHLASKKMQYLGPLGMPNTACYPLLRQTHLLENNSNQATPLQPARSELFLSYMPTTTFNGERERPYIYNYKMPEMPEFVSSNGKTNSQQQLYYQKQQQQQQQQKDNNCDSSAYYISGAQTADLAGPLPPTALYNKSTTNNCSGSIGNSVVGANSNSHGGSNSLLYGGAKPATDVMYYQFDNGKLPIVQQPKSLLNKTTNCDSVGPLVFVHHGGQKQKQKQKSTQNTVATATNQKTCTNNNNKMNTKPITNISNMHKHPKRSQLDIDEEDETEVNEESTTSQHNNAETQNNKYYECDEEPNKEDENENVKATENVLSFMSNSHSSNNNRTDDEQLLSPTNETITNANNNENTANSVSNLANFNLDNCNANTNPVQQSNTTGTNITNDKTKTSLIPNIDGTYNCNRNQNDTMTNRNDNFAYEVNYNHNQNQNQNQNYNQPIDKENENQLNSNSNLLQNRNLSSSLEIILSPIIQSSRRAQ